MSNNLGLDVLAGNQTNKFVTINDANEQIDAALTAALAVAITSSNIRTLTTLEFQRSQFFVVDEDGGDPATAAITLTVPAILRGVFIINNETAFDVTVTIASQPITAPVLAAGDTAILTCDGTNVEQPIASVAAPAAETKAIAIAISGLPTAGQVVLVVFDRSLTIPVNGTGSQGYALITSTAQADITLHKNGGGAFGTFRFAIGTNAVSLVSFSATSFVAGDRLEFRFPGSQDTTLANLGITLQATLD